MYVYTSSSLRGCSLGVKEKLSTSSEKGGFHPWGAEAIGIVMHVCLYTHTVTV